MASKDFISQVREYQAKHKSTRTKAMIAVASADPAAHKAYLESAQKESVAEGDSGKDFMTLVDEYEQRHNCGRVKAMHVIVRRFPNEHRKFIDAANR